MAKHQNPNDPPQTALTVASTTLAPGSPSGSPGLVPNAPTVAVQRAVKTLLQGSVDAFGDVVDALICDLDSATAGLEQVAWLASTRAVLEKEQSWQAALGQLAWWDQFLAVLPSPELLSERRRAELQRYRALRARALIQAREDALLAHREAVGDPLADPEPGEWRVDVAAFEQRALHALPPAPKLVPIVPADLDAAHSFAGFNAVQALRDHPELGPRARHLDTVIAASLRQEFGLSKASALANAQVLTGIFWIALRRALGVGSHQLASAIRLLAQTDHGPVQEQFTRELLLSWLAVLQDLPVQDRKRLGGGLGGGLRRLLGEKQPAALPVDAPRQLELDDQPGLWGRVKKGLGLK
ncbi:MAG: hypothetical protein GXP62_10210 [Oligoflexia bacterium]|nr:hypothetical protein [Oligoflexia bacterium]